MDCCAGVERPGPVKNRVMLATPSWSFACAVTCVAYEPGQVVGPLRPVLIASYCAASEVIVGPVLAQVLTVMASAPVFGSRVDFGTAFASVATT